MHGATPCEAEAEGWGDAAEAKKTEDCPQTPKCWGAGSPSHPSDGTSPAGTLILNF